MELEASYLGTLFKLAQGYTPTLLLTALVTITVFAISFSRGRGNAIKNIQDPIPYVFNTLQFAFNNARFMERARYVVTVDYTVLHLTDPF